MRFLTAAALVVALLVPGVALAEFHFDPSAVTLGVGPAVLQNVGNTFFLSGRVDLGEFSENVLWEGGLHWWQKTDTTQFDFFGQVTETRARYRDLAVTSGAKYLFTVDNDQWLPYVRGGLGLNLIDVSVKSTVGTQTVEASSGSSDLGLYMGGGIAYRQSPSLLLGLEGTFHVTDADHFLLGFTASFPIGGRADVAER